MADGDGRTVLNMVEEVFGSRGRRARRRSTAPALTELVQRRAPLYDKSRDGHYNLISALHKSVRGSDPDAALYWLARMLDGGEDRLYIARRLVRMAIEDIGLADPQAVVQALAAKETFDFLGIARGRAGAGADRRLSGHRAQIECGLRRLRRGHARGQGARQPGAAQAHPQRADAAHEGGGLRRRLRVRPRARRRPSPARTISPTTWRASSSTPPTAAASRRRSRSGWSTGPSCARSGADDAVSSRLEADSAQSRRLVRVWHVALASRIVAPGEFRDDSLPPALHERERSRRSATRSCVLMA